MLKMEFDFGSVKHEDFSYDELPLSRQFSLLGGQKLLQSLTWTLTSIRTTSGSGARINLQVARRQYCKTSLVNYSFGSRPSPGAFTLRADCVWEENWGKAWTQTSREVYGRYVDAWWCGTLRVRVLQTT